MKIIQIIPYLAEAGAEVFVVDLCNEQSKNHDVTLIVFFNNKPDDFVYKRLNEKVKVVYFDKHLGFDSSIIFKLTKTVRNLRPDVIHTHLNAVNYLISVLPFIHKTKIFHTIHNDAYKETGNTLRKFKYWFHKFRIVTAVTISDETERSFKKAYKGVNSIQIDNGRSKVTPSQFIDDVKQEIEEYREGGQYKILLNIGRLSYQKNHEMLVDVIHELVNDGLLIKLCIIGGARPDEEHIESYIKNRSNKHIHLLGTKPNATDYLLYVDAFCLSSRFEGMPISLLEALSTGCVPVCTPAGGIPQIIINGQSGFISDDFTKNSFKHAIIEWYNAEENTLNTIRTNCKEIYNNNYSMASCSQKYIEAFRKN